MPGGTGLSLLGAHLPSQLYDVGIAEQHAVTFCGGLAAGGAKPFCCIYSTFLQRAYDQIVHDVALQSLPVRFIIDRAGLVGADGSTHQGAYDLSFLSNIPNFTVMAPSDEQELVHMLAVGLGVPGKKEGGSAEEVQGTVYQLESGPSAIRFPRSASFGIEVLNSKLGHNVQEFQFEGKPLPLGKGRIIRRAHPKAAFKLRCIDLPDRFIEAAAREQQLKEAGLTAPHFAAEVLRMLHARAVTGSRRMAFIAEAAKSFVA
ncbi:1-deoxy-d-xylulose 5-phosphate [Cyclospora cayetanensis]|uniref:1-deoxy-d-xylulose 5-phosphate n=1 Tax=Cyclospora cayetanensis TaxID=88456 RepID=A0A1D3CRE2_9EIME|nr:1-deoxy-d-xylulose 5-phosphate [Cyclospora cayetanensis]